MYRDDFREATALAGHQGPQWCLFCLDTDGNVPDIKEQFNLLNSLWERDGYYGTHYFLNRVDQLHRWRCYSPIYGDPALALSQWRRMLEDIYTIRYLANLSATQVLEFSLQGVSTVVE